MLKPVDGPDPVMDEITEALRPFCADQRGIFILVVDHKDGEQEIHAAITPSSFKSCLVGHFLDWAADAGLLTHEDETPVETVH